MLPIFQAYGTSPAKKDLFRSEQKIRAISIGGRWSGPGDFSEEISQKARNLICSAEDS